MHKHVISCRNCQHESVFFEPFTVLSLVLPVSGNSILKRLLHNYYEDTVITYKCPQCSKEGESCMKTIIQKMPLILVLHLNRKKQNLSDKPPASYSLCAVSNHFGTLSVGHYTSYCRPSHGNVWYSCDDRSVSRLRTPVKTSAAYLLFYNSLQNGVSSTSSASGTSSFVVWGLGWVGNCLVSLGENGWGIDAWPVVGMGMAVLRQTNVGCRVLWSFHYTSRTPSVPVFPIPIGPIVSHTSRTPSCPLFPTMTTLMHPRPDAESCCSKSHTVAGCWSLP